VNVSDVVVALLAIANLHTIAREWMGRGWEARTGRQGPRIYQLAVRELIPGELLLIGLALSSANGVFLWIALVTWVVGLPLAASIAIFNRPRFLIAPRHRLKSWRDFPR
jgi:hypothetical protein